VAQVTISDPTKFSQLHVARPEVGFESRSEEYSRGAQELALGWQSSSKLYIQTWGQTNKQKRA
jgi:hypothetical protein